MFLHNLPKKNGPSGVRGCRRGREHTEGPCSYPKAPVCIFIQDLPSLCYLFNFWARDLEFEVLFDSLKTPFSQKVFSWFYVCHLGT